MVDLRKTNFVAEVPFKDKPGGNVIGTAKVEKTKSGYLVAHVDMTGLSSEHLLRGFSFGVKDEASPCVGFDD